MPAEFAFIARELGYFDDRHIEIVQYGSPIELSRHFREGSLDAAALTVDFLPYWSASIPSLDVVFAVDISSGADALLARPPIRDLQGLRGRRVGVESSPLGAHMLVRAMQAGGLSPRDFTMVSIDTEDQADAYMADRVDAVVTYEPDRTRLVDAGAKVLFDSSQVPGQVVDVLIVPTPIAEARASELRDLIAGWLAAFERLRDDREATVQRVASGLKVDRPTVEKSLAGVRLGDLALNRELLGGPTPKLATTLEEIEKTAAAAGLPKPTSRGRIRFVDAYLPSIVSRQVGQKAVTGAP